MKVRTEIRPHPDSKLTIIGRLPPKGGRRLWLFECECGQQVRAPAYAVENGSTKSCGCYGRSLIGERSVTHGHSRGRKPSSELQAYYSAKARCYRPSNEKFPHYGGRGIKICDRWKDSPDQFLQDMGIKPGPEYTLERIDTDKDYSPDNCCWATKSTQNRNYSRNVMVVVNGKEVPAIDAPRAPGVTYFAFLKRIHRGWDADRAATAPPRITKSG